MIVSLLVNLSVLTAALKAAKVIVSQLQWRKAIWWTVGQRRLLHIEKRIKIGEKKKTEEKDLYLLANLSIITFSSFQLKSESF